MAGQKVTVSDLVSPEAVERITGMTMAEIVDSVARADLVDEAQAEVSNLEHDVDRCEERLWRLAALTGYVPAESDNNATAELVVAEAIRGVVKVLALCDEWDALSKGETPTTRKIREALR